VWLLGLLSAWESAARRQLLENGQLDASDRELATNERVARRGVKRHARHPSAAGVNA
jgi:hypothetical protein